MPMDKKQPSFAYSDMQMRHDSSPSIFVWGFYFIFFFIFLSRVLPQRSLSGTERCVFNLAWPMVGDHAKGWFCPMRVGDDGK